MARILVARRISLSQKIIIGLVLANLVLVGAYTVLASRLSMPAAVIIPALLVVFNLLTTRLVIRRSRRTSDRPLLYTMIATVLMLGMVLLIRLFG